MTHLDVQGRAEKACNSRPEDVKDVGSIFILDIFFNREGTCRRDVFSTVIKRPNVCWGAIARCVTNIFYFD